MMLFGKGVLYVINYTVLLATNFCFDLFFVWHESLHRKGVYMYDVLLF